MSELVCKTLELLAETKGGFTFAVKNILNTKTMGTLKISDLSVGDWVNVMTEKLTSLVLCEEVEITRGYIHTQIKGIREDGYIAVGTADGCYTLVDIGCISPILITAEMLKKNGWECVEVGDKGPATPKQNYNRFERWRLETKWGKRDLFFDRATKVYRLNGMNDCKFAEVHKLQHTLRLSDIYNYEINL